MKLVIVSFLIFLFSFVVIDNIMRKHCTTCSSRRLPFLQNYRGFWTASHLSSFGQRERQKGLYCSVLCCPSLINLRFCGRKATPQPSVFCGWTVHVVLHRSSSVVTGLFRSYLLWMDSSGCTAFCYVWTVQVVRPFCYVWTVQVVRPFCYVCTV